MAQEIEYEQLERSAQPSGGGAVALDRVGDIPMQLSVEIGRAQATVGEVLTLTPGTVVTLDTLAGEPVDLLANGTPIARGEVVLVGDKLGLRIKDIVEVADEQLGDPVPGADQGSPAAAARAQATATVEPLESDPSDERAAA